MAVSARLRLVSLVVLTAGLCGAGLALLAGSDPADGAASGEPRGQRTPGRQMLLRPQDLGKGFYFLVFNEGPPVPKLTCGQIKPAEPTPDLRSWLALDKPAGCMTLYAHYRRRSLQIVGTGATDAGSEARAREGLSLALDLLATGQEESGAGDPTELPPTGTVGDESRFLSWEGEGLFSGRAGGVLVAWRSGDVLAAVYSEGKSSVRANQRDALVLARRQQRKRIEHPSRFNPGRTADG